jgi:hypothetical protein
MLGFEVLARGVFPRDAIVTEYRRRVSVRWEGGAAAHINQTWNSYLRSSRGRGVKVYNGDLLRLDDYCHEKGILRMQVSDVDFRSYVGTALPAFAEAFPGAPQANPLAVCIVLVTSDGKIVLERRSQIDAYRGRYHVIAGFMEKDADTANGGPDPFEVINREVREELGVVLDGEPLATGLIRTAMGSEVCFSSRLSISFETLLETKAGARTDAEIDDLLEIGDSPTSIVSFLAEHDRDIVPSGRACLLLHGRVKYGEEWYYEATERLSG